MESEKQPVNFSQSRMSAKWWYVMKIAQHTLIGVCILLLIINQYLSGIKDDFTPVHQNSSQRAKRWTPLFALEDVDFGIRVKRNTSDDSQSTTTPKPSVPTEHSKTKLSYFLVLYPCCTTTLVILFMELISKLLKDPLNRISNLILVIVGIAITVVIFSVSLACAIDTSHICMILITVLSAGLTILIFIDIVFILLPKRSNK